VWRVDRFGRSLNDGVQIIERIRRAGGRFYSVQDGLDIDTEAGRLALRVLLSVAEFHLEGLRASWDAAREHAIGRGGMHLAKTVPVGYRRTGSGRLLPHPMHGVVIAELYERRAVGESVHTVCRFLEDHGVRTGKGNPGWSTSALSKPLRSRVYLGEVYHGDYRNAHALPPLTSGGRRGSPSSASTRRGGAARMRRQ
jgi:hypothetical protein